MEVGMQERVKLVDRSEDLSIRQQVNLLNICRSRKSILTVVFVNKKF